MPLSCKALTEDCTIDLIAMTGPCCESLLNTCALTESGIYQVSDDSPFQPFLEQMLRLHRRDAAQEAYTKLCYALLVDLSSRVSRLRESQSAEPSVEAVQVVISYLETHYQHPVSLDVLADKVHLTKEYLCVLFKRETGHTILNYLTPFLRPCHNTLSAAVLRCGEDPWDSNHSFFRSAMPGLYVEGLDDEPWRRRREENITFFCDEAAFSPMRMNEKAAPGGPNEGWMEPDFDDTDWSEARCYADDVIPRVLQNLRPRPIGVAAHNRNARSGASPGAP